MRHPLMLLCASALFVSACADPASAPPASADAAPTLAITRSSGYPQLTILPQGSEVPVGFTHQLSVRGTARDGSTSTMSNVSWSSSNTKVATISTSGAFRAIAPGTLNLRASVPGGQWVAIDVTVTGDGSTTPPPSEEPGTEPIELVVERSSGYPQMTILPQGHEVPVGFTTQLSVQSRTSSGATSTMSGVTWSSSNTKVATVSSSGAFRAVADGMTVLKATKDGQWVTVGVKVGTGGSADASPSPEPSPEPTPEPSPEPTPEPSPDAPTTGFFVAPNGSSSGDGSIGKPWNLATALNQPSAVKAGTTIWLRGGTYKGAFVSRLSGSSSSPVVLRQYPGERAIIDGTLDVTGGYSTYWGFEVTSSVSAPADEIAVDVSAPGVKLINLVVHDAGGAGLGVWTGASGAEVHGNIIYNNGRQRVIEGFSHGIYAQNASGTQRYSDNVVFNQFAYGFHMYGSEAAALRGFQLEGNVVFENGAPASSRGSVNMLIGGGAPASGISVVENYAYKTSEGTNVRLGYSAQNQDLVARNNYFAGGFPALRMNKWSTATVSGNTLASAGEVLNVESSLSGFSWSNNTHYRDPSTSSWTVNGSGRTFSSFTSSTGFSGEKAYSGLPTTNKVVVRPNKYEKGRGHIVVYNWSGASSVSVSLSNVLASGDQYEILNVQDLFGTPVATGTYSGGSVSLPIRAVAAPTPVGGFINRPAGTGTQFNTYLVRKVGS